MTMAVDRTKWTPARTIDYIWTALGLPKETLSALNLVDEGHAYPSSYKIAHLAQASIGLSALAAALVSSVDNGKVPTANVAVRHALVEFISERLYTIDSEQSGVAWGPISGLYQTADGHIRIHDNFINHRNAALDVLGIDRTTPTRELVAEKCKRLKAVELETAAAACGAIMFALRTPEEWSVLEQARVLPECPVELDRLDDGSRLPSLSRVPPTASGCLSGLRVVELSRVIAGPVAGRTLAAHGADVIWVTSPNLPNLPALEVDMSRGKRHLELDLNLEHDRKALRRLIANADIFLQAYRPDALESKGFGFAEVAAMRPGIVYANLSAWGNRGPWSQRRGFDSMVQTVSGMNVSEARHSADGSSARPTPCQALDHAAGYLLATGIMAALYRRSVEGGSWKVNVSLASTMHYLTRLGQYPGRTGFEPAIPVDLDHMDDLVELSATEYGELSAVRHSAVIDGKSTRLAACIKVDTAEWL